MIDHIAKFRKKNDSNSNVAYFQLATATVSSRPVTVKRNLVVVNAAQNFKNPIVKNVHTAILAIRIAGLANVICSDRLAINAKRPTASVRANRISLVIFVIDAPTATTGPTACHVIAI